MKIGIIGVGHIGKTLALRLAEKRHDVSVAGSRGPEHIDTSVLASGARPVTIEQALQDKDVIILSIPLNRIPGIAFHFTKVASETTVIDTSNYYPARDNKIDSIEAGLVESLWVQEQLGRPISKAWNAIGSDSFSTLGKISGSLDRIAIAISADRQNDRKITMRLVDDTGFDAFDMGSIADSWRQQPGSPVYCTDLTHGEMQSVVDTAEKKRLPVRRDLAVAAIHERMGDAKTNPDSGYAVRLNRALFL